MREPSAENVRSATVPRGFSTFPELSRQTMPAGAKRSSRTRHATARAILALRRTIPSIVDEPDGYFHSLEIQNMASTPSPRLRGDVRARGDHMQSLLPGQPR